MKGTVWVGMKATPRFCMLRLRDPLGHLQMPLICPPAGPRGADTGEADTSDSSPEFMLCLVCWGRTEEFRGCHGNTTAVQT